MQGTATRLAATQRLMLSAVTDPSGDPARRFTPLIAASTLQTPAERLAVYRNAYVARLVECLAAEFPVFRETVGEDAFNALAVDYLRRFPSRSYTLGRLGSRFVRHVRAVARDVGTDDETARGRDEFLVDLARFERLRSEVFDGPGHEADHRHVTAVTDQLVPESRVPLTPSRRLITFRWPVHDYWRAMRRGESASGQKPRRARVVVWRRDYAVVVRELDDFEWVLLTHLGGDSLGDALNAAARRSGVADLPERVHRFLAFAAGAEIVLPAVGRRRLATGHPLPYRGGPALRSSSRPKP